MTENYKNMQIRILLAWILVTRSNSYKSHTKQTENHVICLTFWGWQSLLSDTSLFTEQKSSLFVESANKDKSEQIKQIC